MGWVTPLTAAELADPVGLDLGRAISRSSK
jgi:hypothetical protein